MHIFIQTTIIYLVLMLPLVAENNATLLSGELDSTHSIELLEGLSNDFSHTPKPESNTTVRSKKIESRTIHLKIMPLGDSITFQASSVHLPDDRTGKNYDIYRHGYRNHLWYKLTDAGYSINFVGSRRTGQSVVPIFDGDNDGYPGISSNALADHVYALLKKNQPDIILLHIGTNDPSTSISGTRKILDNIDKYEKNYNHHIKVIVAQIIRRLDKYDDTITKYNNNLRDLVNYRNRQGDDLMLVNMNSGARINYSTDMIDKLHPNNTGYYKMANVWFDALKKSFVPASPTNLQTSSITDTSVTLTWHDVSDNENIYKIYDKNFKRIATLDKNSTSYKFKNLIQNTKYTYHIVAGNSEGNSDVKTITFTTKNNYAWHVPAIYYPLLLSN